MLKNLLEKAVEVNADRIEIEYKDGSELVTAFCGQFGIGIAWLDDTQRDDVFQEIRKIKKTVPITIRDTVYRLRYSKYESFGEWVHVIELKPAK